RALEHQLLGPRRADGTVVLRQLGERAPADARDARGDVVRVELEHLRRRRLARARPTLAGHAQRVAARALVLVRTHGDQVPARVLGEIDLLQRVARARPALRADVRARAVEERQVRI